MSQDVEIFYPPGESCDGFSAALAGLRRRADGLRRYTVADRLAALQALSDQLLARNTDQQPGLAFLAA
ncbi:MAG: hypothetical protein GTO03_05550, partial [Planctomycetales bacterium]|nr:hypothetical protein [Planctomycetales bacterium]